MLRELYKFTKQKVDYTSLAKTPTKSIPKITKEVSTELSKAAYQGSVNALESYAKADWERNPIEDIKLSFFVFSIKFWY